MLLYVSHKSKLNYNNLIKDTFFNKAFPLVSMYIYKMIYKGYDMNILSFIISKFMLLLLLEPNIKDSGQLEAPLFI